VLYGKTPEERYEKAQMAKEQIEDAAFRERILQKMDSGAIGAYKCDYAQ